MVLWLVAKLAINSFSLWLASQVVSGVSFTGTTLQLVVVALVFGIVNTLIKPLLLLLTLPVTVITLGLFALVINALMLLLTSALVGDYHVDGFIPALLASILISIVSTVLNWFIPH